eukprot:CAMPEP_0202896164 /NCGR_PEP_ID=MMETSP1392-20130828/5210_1 /ASSEMBLY_ACC=CAM_ASM_000868 /TAXON_ID=225041 /ORGANISM="Chlamydomonas chlamydogama, Strain SAG 11-48b" /LENGTH=174 /DNA_ID=CAMNT_0049581411 /DNA_START=5 /DNA_END=529 /DNA_ORIENTATION=+
MADLFLASPRAVGGLVPPPNLQSASNITADILSAGALYAHKLKKLKTSVAPDAQALCTAQDVADAEVYVHKSASSLGEGGVMNAITQLGARLDGRLDALESRIDGLGHQIRAGNWNQSVRLYNNRAFSAGSDLQPLKKEVPHPAPPAGAAPQLGRPATGGRGLPEDCRTSSLSH